MKYFYYIVFIIVATLVANYVLKLIRARWFLALFALGAMAISVVAFVSWYTGTIPESSTLDTIEGTVRFAMPISSKSKDLIIMVDPGGVKYKYLDWYPQYGEVKAGLSAGSPVSIMSGPIDPTTQNAELWSLEIPGTVSVSFEQIANKRRSNANWALGLGISFVVISVILIRAAVQCWRLAEE